MGRGGGAGGQRGGAGGLGGGGAGGLRGGAQAATLTVDAVVERLAGSAGRIDDRVVHEAVQGANTVYQVHAIIAWAFWALFPFSRLVHAWSIPLQYLGRPYILYRRRYAKAPR